MYYLDDTPQCVLRYCGEPHVVDTIGYHAEVINSAFKDAQFMEVTKVMAFERGHLKQYRYSTVTISKSFNRILLLLFRPLILVL